MNKEFSNLASSLKRKEYIPIYFIQGEEEYYINRIIDIIEKEILSTSEKTFDQNIIYGKESNIEKILLLAKKVPMMAQKQVIIVKEAQELADINRERSKKLLLDYISRPNSRTILVFAYKKKTLDGRNEITKKLSSAGFLFTSKKIYESQVPSLIKQIAVSHNRKISEKAVFMLLENTGNSLSKIENEISKIVINTRDGDLIDEVIISKLSGISKDYNIFELQNALTLKDTNKVFNILEYFKANPQSSPLLKMLPLLNSFFSKLLQLKSIKTSHTAEIAKKLSINPYFLKDYIQASKKYQKEKLEEIITQLAIADLKIKGIKETTNKEEQITRDLMINIIS